MKKIFAALIIFMLILSGAGVCFAEDAPQQVDSLAVPYQGSGTPDSPYVYLTDENSKVTWKHLNEIKQNNITDEYEKREGDSTSGALIYRWKFSPDQITSAYGPYFLGINFYSGDSVKGLPGGDQAKYFSFAHKRDFAGVGIVTICVSDCFQDGDLLGLAYYGGYDATVYHTATPDIDSDEIRDVDRVKKIAENLKVSGGYVTFPVRYGGNFFLTKESVQSAAGTDPVNPGQSEPQTVYNSEESLGTINEIFPNEKIAHAIAVQTGKKDDDPVSQGDLDSIQSLFLDGMGLTDLSELSRFTFAHLTSLSLADNELTQLPVLKMPQLGRLDLSGNRVDSLEGLDSTIPLKHLLLVGNGIKVLPDLSKLKTLQTLDLSMNELTNADGLALPNLIYLNLSGNHLQGKPDLSQCPQLAEVELGALSTDKTGAESETSVGAFDPAKIAMNVPLVAAGIAIAGAAAVFGTWMIIKYRRKRRKTDQHG